MLTRRQLFAQAADRVLSGDAKGVLALMDATVVIDDRNRFPRKVWQNWSCKSSLFQCVKSIHMFTTTTSPAPVLQALLQYQSPRGEVITFEKYPRRDAYYLTFGSYCMHLPPSDFWQKVATAWIANRWSAQRQAWIMAVSTASRHRRP